MRFLSMIRVNENTGQVPSEQLMQDMGKLIDEMTREGSLVRTAGLRPTKEGKRVRLRKGGQLSTVDGPFTETKEVIGGFAILEAESMAGGDRAHQAIPAGPRRRLGHRVRSASAGRAGVRRRSVSQQVGERQREKGKGRRENGAMFPSPFGWRLRAH